ncbi:MAG TPA: type II toxin-antitoxin system RelE/ParE family toxin [bacterium]|nr:type II toxin-antitoxin system RelE/ParE family toxin [bacterium]
MADKKYTIEAAESFILDFRNIPKEYHKIINKKVIKLETNPFTGKKLSGKLKEIWRIRVGVYRIGYMIKNEKLVILLLKAGHRKDFYEKLTRIVSELKNL